MMAEKARHSDTYLDLLDQIHVTSFIHTRRRIKAIRGIKFTLTNSTFGAVMVKNVNKLTSFVCVIILVMYSVLFDQCLKLRAWECMDLGDQGINLMATE